MADITFSVTVVSLKHWASWKCKPIKFQMRS